jgi:host factor-I protein
VLETSNQEQLIFKHAISTVVIARGGHVHGEAKPAAVATLAEAAAVPGSGTQG